MSLRLPRKSCVLWQIRLSVLALSIIIVVIFLDLYQKRALFAAAAVFIVWLFVVAVFLPRHFESYVITADNLYITINRGSLFKSQYIIPRNFVLTRAISTPTTKRLGLVLITMKSADRWIVIPEINESDLKFLFKN